MSKAHIFILIFILGTILAGSAGAVFLLIDSEILENNKSNHIIHEHANSELKFAHEASEFALIFPKLNLKNYEGEDVSLHDLIGTPLVINSWAMWCPFCVNELKEFASVQKEFGGRAIIIGINRAENQSKTKSFIDELGITDDLIFLLDSNDAFYRNIGGFSMPETIFVDSMGNVVIHKRGPMAVPEMRDKIFQIL